MHVAAGVVLLFAAIFQSCEGLDRTGAWGALVHPEAPGVGLAGPASLALGLVLLSAAACEIAASFALLARRWPVLVRAGAALAASVALATAAVDGELTIPRILALYGAALALSATPELHAPPGQRSPS